MNKSIKQLIIIFIVAALIVPMFISCDDGAAEPPAVDYKAEFLGALGPKVAELKDKTGVADASLSGQNFTISFETDSSLDADGIKGLAEEFLETLTGLGATGILKISNDGFMTDSSGYDITDDTDLTAFKTDMLAFLGDSGDEPDALNYTATVTYKGKSFDLAGTITLGDIPDLDD